MNSLLKRPTDFERRSTLGAHKTRRVRFNHGNENAQGGWLVITRARSSLEAERKGIVAKSLQLRDSGLNAHFSSFVHAENWKPALLTASLLSFTGLASLFCLLYARDQLTEVGFADIMKFCVYFAAFGVPALIIIMLSRGRPHLLDLAPVSGHLGLTCSLVLTDLVGVLPSDSMAADLVTRVTITLLHFISALFVNGTFVWSVPLRNAFFLVDSIILFFISTRASQGSFPIGELGTLLLLKASLELSHYLNYRSKAKIFLLLDLSRRKSDQFQSLLDFVPDSVLICSNARDREVPRPLFANRAINKLYAADYVRESKPAQPPSGHLGILSAI